MTSVLWLVCAPLWQQHPPLREQRGKVVRDQFRILFQMLSILVLLRGQFCEVYPVWGRAVFLTPCGLVWLDAVAFAHQVRSNSRRWTQ